MFYKIIIGLEEVHYHYWGHSSNWPQSPFVEVTTVLIVRHYNDYCSRDWQNREQKIKTVWHEVLYYSLNHCTKDREKKIICVSTLTNVTELKNMYKTVSIYRWKLLKIQDVLFKQCEKVKQKIHRFCLSGVCVHVCMCVSVLNRSKERQIEIQKFYILLYTSV